MTAQQSRLLKTVISLPQDAPSQLKDIPLSRSKKSSYSSIETSAAFKCGTTSAPSCCFFTNRRAADGVMMAYDMKTAGEGKRDAPDEGYALLFVSHHKN